MKSPVQVAATLAGALDREDYGAARSCLHDDCVYQFRGEIIEGADAIIASYRNNGEAGRKRFDEIEYESSVSPLGEERVRIDYTDKLTHAGDRHVHRCAQEISVGTDGTVTRIVHVDLDGEREALAAFEARHP